MRTKYFLAACVVSVQIVITFFTCINANRIRVFEESLTKPHPQFVFTQNDSTEIKSCLAQLNSQAKFFFSINDKVNLNEDSTLLYLMKEVFNAYPIHLLNTRGGENWIELDVLFNRPRPGIITFSMIKQNDGYKINGIKNLCDLIKLVNRSFENEPKWRNEKI